MASKTGAALWMGCASLLLFVLPLPARSVFEMLQYSNTNSDTTIPSTPLACMGSAVLSVPC